MDIIEAIHADLVAIRRAFMKGGNRLALGAAPHDRTLC